MAGKYIPPHLRQRLANVEASAVANTEPSDRIAPLNLAASTLNDSEVKIIEVKLVATYNWIDRLTPTILGPVLNFAREPKEYSAFKFGVQLVGKTLIFVRMEDNTRDYFTRPQYRIAFEQIYTAVESVAKRTTSHHRILNYKFGGLNLLVRSVADAYLPKHPSVATEQRDESSMADLDPEVAKGVLVLEGGRIVPQAAILKLTTRFAFSKQQFRIAAKIPDLWISQTPHFVEAYYKHEKPIWETFSPRAIFDTPKLTDVRDMVQDWEARGAHHLQKFAGFLHQIVETVRTSRPDGPKGTSYSL
ncbi:hypothetical protein H2201_007137 [Coniosporium apollinis]|uniref:Uncharacterized protein n=1 Tax=Coniosporium apollinis TaxID=61459 RepID=A0ABQ9NRI2_9PEZI|nr:hypothetical protein H2201_007137 [Coniosporium apollinis]